MEANGLQKHDDKQNQEIKTKKEGKQSIFSFLLQVYLLDPWQVVYLLPWWTLQPSP